MTTAYTSLLGLALPVTGELSGTWGDTVNTAITSLLDTAVAGTTSITTDSDITLTTTTGASNQARQAIILWNPASGTTTRNITAPAQSKIYTVINASGGTQSIVIRGAGPTTGVTIAKGESATVAWNGSDFVKVGSSGGAITFTDLTVTGNTILGDAAADTLTVNATSTFASPVNFQGQVKLPSTGRSAAAALTPTNPAFLYGVASTYTDTTSSGTLAPVATFYSLAQPTLSTSNVTTYTNAATLYLANAPAAGGSATITNPYALYVAAGASYFGGNVTYGGNLTVAGNVLPSAGSTYNIGASGTTWNNFYINYIKPVGGAAYVTTPLMDNYPDVNAVKIYHSGTPASDYNFGSAGSTAGSGLIAESVAYQATFSNGPGFIFSTAASGGKLLSLTTSGVGIGKNSAAYSLDIQAASTSDLLLLRRGGSTATAFSASGDGAVTWGNGSTDYGQLSWDTGQASIAAKSALYLKTNIGTSSVSALYLTTAGDAVFYKNVNISAGGNAYLTGSLGSRFWTPGLAIGYGYSGLYGPTLTYLAERSGSTWVSTGGGTGTALTLDEGSFQVLKSQGVGAAGTTLVWSPIISTTGQQVGIGRSAPSSFTDLSIAQNNTYAIGFDTAGATQNYSYRIDSTNSNAWTLGARTTSVDLYWIQPSGNAVYTQTGALRVHNGTTAQRSTSSAGAIRWNTSYPQLEVADGTNYHKIVTEPIVTSASGGTITTDGDYKVHTFTSSGTFTLTTISGATRVLVQVMILGGGGGGGFYLGGGGGSGAMLETEVSMSASAYTVTVGAGGAAVNSGLTYSGNGGFSSITGSLVSLNANGGGAGGNGQIGDAWGANGNATSNIGSGGGGGSPYGVALSNANVNVVLGGSAGWNGSGGACGTTYTGSFTFNGGGGGGGAQSAGVAPNIGNGPVGAGGYGGSARPSYITGSLVSYGGGGGGGYGSYLANQAIGGGSGAGYGVGSANSGPTLQATAGTANQGGGGGGGQAYSPYQQGGAGGSGIVIIRYKFQ